MNPTRVTATAYRSYDQLDLALPSGAFAITGRNGAGKSSILLVIDLCLFGGRDLSRYMNRTRGERMRIGLEVEHRGVLYRIQRSYNPAGRGKTTLDFERHDGDVELGVDQQEEPIASMPEWLPLTEGNARDTQQLIEQTFGLSRETFRASAYLSQGDAAAFTEADAADRKRILADVLGLGVWDAVLEVAKRDRGIAQEQLAKAQATIDLATELRVALVGAARNRDEAAEVREAHSEVQRRLRAVWEAAAAKHSQEKQIEAGRAEIEGRARLAQQEYAAADRDLTQIEQSRAAALGELERVDQARPLAGRLAALEEQGATLALARQEWGQVTEQRRELERQHEQAGLRFAGDVDEAKRRADELDAARAALTRVDEAGAVCDSCGQPLMTGEAREARRSKLSDAVANGEKAVVAWEASSEQQRAELERLAGQLAELRERLEPDQSNDLHAALVRARGAAAVLAGEPAARQRLAEADVALPAASGRLSAAHTLTTEAGATLAALGDAPPLEDLAKAERAAQVALGESERGLATLTASWGEAKGRYAMLEERITALGDPQADLAASATELTILDQLVEAYGRNGVPALIIESSALPHLEGEANRILADLGTSMLVELRTQRALKSAAGVRETLDIIVKMDGAEALYEDFSGGERSRLNVSLRIALARLLAHRRGSDVRMLVLDEPEYLDDAGTAQLAQVLHGLTGDFERVALVSHVAGLQDAFDTVITVERDEGDVSRIVA